jgi:type II secretory pathway pseudopilin PulG
MNFPKLRPGEKRISADLRRRHAGEEGYILIAVLFMVAMVLIMLSIAAPKIAADIERDREIELQHRGHQFERAIKLYYKKFGAYPPNMEALEKSNEIRFLRKRYKDPATGKDEWHLIHFGENKMPTAWGFFGQPLAGTTVAGIGPGGMGQNAGSSIIGNNGASSNGIGNVGLSDPNAGNPSSNTNNASNGNTATSTDPNAPSTSGGGTNAGGSGSTSAFGNSSTGGNNQTFGGGGIIGVESTSPKATILEYKKKKHFNEWEFVYDPQADRIMISGNTGAIGTPVGNGGMQSPGASGLSPNGGGGTSIPPPPPNPNPNPNPNQQQ